VLYFSSALAADVNELNKQQDGGTRLRHDMLYTLDKSDFDYWEKHVCSYASLKYKLQVMKMIMPMVLIIFLFTELHKRKTTNPIANIRDKPGSLIRVKQIF
jgi:hypothetical protein